MMMGIGRPISHNRMPRIVVSLVRGQANAVRMVWFHGQPVAMGGAACQDAGRAREGMAE